MTGDVDVLGQVEYLEVWNHDRFVTKLASEPFTDDDARALAGFLKSLPPVAHKAPDATGPGEPAPAPYLSLKMPGTG